MHCGVQEKREVSYNIEKKKQYIDREKTDMFFMIGIYPGENKLDNSPMITCPHCGRLGRITISMIYNQLVLFFIPVFRWGYRYIGRMSCCGAGYEVVKEKAEQIRRGLSVTLDEGDLIPLSGLSDSRSTCPFCGREVEDDFEFCPGCGRSLREK
jgi:hypothetical protein